MVGGMSGTEMKGVSKRMRRRSGSKAVGVLFPHFLFILGRKKKVFARPAKESCPASSQGHRWERDKQLSVVVGWVEAKLRVKPKGFAPKPSWKNIMLCAGTTPNPHPAETKC